METDYLPEFWKYCTKCGTDLKRAWDKSTFDVISGKEQKRVIVYCPAKDSLYHTWNSYEADTLEVSEIKF